MTIRSLFDPSKDIYRTIEKVITYGASQEGRLKAEISEYVVTESIEEQFRKILDRMQLAMESGGENEIGVWVSGFYGSGKSSFTKYLGLAFDDQRTIDGTPFINYLQDRLHKPQTKALLSTVAKRFPAAVVMLDLASEMLAGATMEDVSTVLYFKVLQWAGYSRNLKVAALERKLKRDGRYDEFLALFKQTTEGEAWQNYRNDELVVDSLIPEIAHQLYPTLFKTGTSFTTETSEIVVFTNDRVREMLEIAREASGKDYIVFIIDEVGQYVGPRPNLILNLDGLAKNLKNIGDGKVWIVGTAQQTLTADDAKAALNSPELFKLNQEMMALYKREKINPLGGCLPIAVQIPVFIALYWALLGAVEIRDAPWILWITDLSAADPYYVLPVIMMVTMLVQTKLNPTPPDPIQAKVMMMMPFIFGVMFFFFPAGLVLYWVVNNLLSIAQQWQITRMIEGGTKAANDSKV